ncbi:MAG: EscU/YscU/HrcU family type III secretion system export apparatus switch protein [Gammaproteobacteria bacterium]|nr:EscU/YscU/HrcU family type III secretion system export apparatus switch protein [Gammaproteobacteria bacterium]
MSERNNKKPLTAVALHYDGSSAPRVTAKGQHAIAEKILEIARANNIPLYQDVELTGLLSRLELGDEIPENLYLAVARVIAFVYQLAGRTTLPLRPPADRP